MQIQNTKTGMVYVDIDGYFEDSESLLRSSATYHTMLGSDSVIRILNLSACPFLFVALVFFFKKAYQLMRLPILGSDNFRFFGVLLYGGSVALWRTRF